MIQCVIYHFTSMHYWITGFCTTDKELFEVGDEMVPLYYGIEVIQPSAQGIRYDSFASPPIANVKVESLKFIILPVTWKVW